MSKRKKDIVFLSVISLFVLFFIASNFKDEKFLDMNMYQILSLVFVITVSYYLTQKQLDVRKEKDVLNDTVKEVIEISHKLTRDSIQSENSKMFILALRDIENRINLINSIANRYDIVDKIDYIKREINIIDNMVSNHINKSNELITIFVDIEKSINNIQYKCVEIQFKIYFN